MPEGYAEIHETHTGVVFLVGDRAYKLKKPVDFEFCDLTTPAARMQACRREVELNRRLAPDVYLGVAEMTVPGLPGNEIEPMVVMRRMAESTTLSGRVRTGSDTEDDIREIARTVAVFHERCHHSPRVATQASREALRGRWTDNLDHIRRLGAGLLDPAELDAVAHDAGEFLAGREPLLNARIAGDRIVDGHGDLLADDIFCLPDGPRILDCLEFDDRLRHVDRIDDIAFLAMDLERIGSPGLAARLLGWYREFGADNAPPSLVHHYIAYRALVRAKASCLRSAQGDPDARLEARALLESTRRHLSTGAVRLVLVGGPPGTGKSTLAGHLADELGHVVLRSDRLYAELLTRAEALLGMGESVILDASWTSRTAREAAAGVAARTHSRLVALRCEAPGRLAAARTIGRQGGPSDADPSVAAAMRADTDLWPEATAVDTTGPAHEATRFAIDHIHPPHAGLPWPAWQRDLAAAGWRSSN